MIPEQASLPTIPELLKETLRLAREKRKETSRLLWQLMAALSPILLILVVYLILKVSGYYFDNYMGHQGVNGHLGALFWGFLLLIFALPAYTFFLLYFMSKILSGAQQIALIAIDNSQPLFTFDRTWAYFRMTLLLGLPSVIVSELFLFAHITKIPYINILLYIPYLILYTAIPAVVERGKALKALGISWELARSHFFYVLKCAIIGWIPSIVSIILALAAVGTAVLLSFSKPLIAATAILMLIVPLLVFAIQFEPFYKGLIYRALKPRSDDNPSVLPTEPLLQRGGTV
jgi:hypothetical protein